MIPVMRAFHGLLDTQFAAVTQQPIIEQHMETHHIVTHSRRLLYRFRTHFHPYSERLMAELVLNDIPGLQALNTAQPELRADFFEALYHPKTAISPQSTADLGSDPAAVLSGISDGAGKPLSNLLPVKEIDFDYAEGAYAVYNWEIFYHVPFLVAAQLTKNQRFAEAQHWLHYIFNPTDNSDGPTPQRFWKVRPFQISEVEHVEQTLLNLSTGNDPELQQRTVAAIGAWRDSPFRPHLIARTRPTAYMYATVMAYLDNLIAWGDSLFRQDTREAINEATQYYILAANILGPKPQIVPEKGTLKVQTYAALRADLDEFGNAVRDLEADIPFDLLGPGRPVNGAPADAPLESVGRSLYFCVPRNETLLSYWDTVGDRLFKIRNSLNFAGIFRQLPLFPPPIDPAMLARAVAAGVDIASIIAGTDAPLAPVRFQLLLQKAVEITQEVKSLGGQILSALEKKDNEALSSLRAHYESNLLSLGETTKYAQWQEAKKNSEGVLQSIANGFERFKYYARLLGADATTLKLPDYTALDVGSLESGNFSGSEPDMQSEDVRVELGSSFRDGGHKINPSEAHELDYMEVAQILQDVGTVLEGVGAGLNMVPDIGAHATPFGVGVAVTEGGSNLGRLFQALAAVSRGVAGRIQHESAMAGKMASYDRREQEWTFQKKVIAGEITQLFKQYRGAEIREAIAKREYDNHKVQLKQAQDIEDFLVNEKRRTATEGFHLWMKREAQGLHTQSFQFAYDVAKKAERAFQFELADPGARFLGTAYLGGREGLFAGEKLLLDLKRMELAYAELNTREYELTRHISLRDWFPIALISLRNTGHCDLTIPEALFDLDCPGHCFRRLRSVAVSVPCVLGPYASLNVSLLLTGSQIRTKAVALDNQWYPADPANPDTDRFTSYPVACSAVVTSTAQNDTGTFETNLRDERYLPFEGAGVISNWSLDMPGSPRQFDFDTISDVILTFRYTSRPGAAPGEVSGAVSDWLKANSARVFSIRHEFPGEWARFKSSTVAASQAASLSFTLGDEHYPYRMQDVLTSARQVHLFAQTSSPQVAAELLRAGVSVGKATLGNGEGVIAPAVGGKVATLDARGLFELRLDTIAIDDLWMVFEWSA